MTPRIHRAAVFLLLLLAAVGPPDLPAQSPAPPTSAPDLARHFEPYDAAGTFVLYDRAGDRWIRHNPDMARARAIPASTYKIFHSLVALETGVIGGEEEVIPWDGADRGSRGWNQDQTLRTAFQRSAVWAYQVLARRIGSERMTRWLRSEGYGNGDISGGIDRFWLTGGLRISLEEQVEFLRRLHEGRLGFSARTQAIVRRIMVVDEGPGYVLRAKTGWARPEGPDGIQIGWLVGWIERDDDAHFFALRLETSDPAFPMREAREAITYGILRELGLLPDATMDLAGPTLPPHRGAPIPSTSDSHGYRP